MNERDPVRTENFIDCYRIRLLGNFSLTQNPNESTLRPLFGLPQTPHVSQTGQRLGSITGHYIHWAEILTYHRQTQKH